MSTPVTIAALIAMGCALAACCPSNEQAEIERQRDAFESGLASGDGLSSDQNFTEAELQAMEARGTWGIAEYVRDYRAANSKPGHDTPPINAAAVTLPDGTHAWFMGGRCLSSGVVGIQIEYLLNGHLIRATRPYRDGYGHTRDISWLSEPLQNAVRRGCGSVEQP